MGMREEIRVHLCAEMLYKGRKTTTSINGFKPDTTPDSIVESYRIQDKLIIKYLNERKTIRGWKAGVVSSIMQTAVGTKQSVEAPLFSICTNKDINILDISKFVKPGLEVELACKIKKDVDQNQDSWNTDSIEEYIESISLAIEVIDTRGLPEIKNNFALHVANFADNVECIVGEPIESWKNINFMEEKITTVLNDKEIDDRYADYLGHSPIYIASWLFNRLIKRRVKLKKNDYLLLGCLSHTIWLEEGEKLSVSSKNLGNMSIIAEKK